MKKRRDIRSEPRASARRLARLMLVGALGLLALAPAAPAGFTGFQSPSHNIGCFIAKSSGVRCDIARHGWKSPPKPASCPVDYGGGVQVGKRGRAGFVCAGDTTLNQGRVLAYGSSIRRGRYRCASKQSGMRCVNLRNGHGFKLSRERVRLF